MQSVQQLGSGRGYSLVRVQVLWLRNYHVLLFREGEPSRSEEAELMSIALAEAHYAHGVRAADEIKALGRSFRVSGDCSTIAEQFRQRAVAITDKYKAADVAFDQRTQFGRTQGAKFP